MSRNYLGIGSCAVALVLSVSSAALAQTPTADAPAPAEAPAAPPAADPPAAAPATGSATPQVAVPPGYMLVKVGDPAGQTRYDVQYPQTRGALPPGLELPYEEGDTIPDGYRLRKQPRRGLVIAGSIVTGVAWGLSVMGAVESNFNDNSGFLLIPALGPWLMLASGGAKDEPCGSNSSSSNDYCYDRDNSALRAVLVLDGLTQVAGTLMFVGGLAFPRQRLVRSDVTVSVLPSPVGRDGFGLGAVGTF